MSRQPLFFAVALFFSPVTSEAARFRGNGGGFQPGAGFGPGFVDANGDGYNDYMDANGDGVNDFTGLAMGSGPADRFVDANGDGHNDYMDANGDGINDFTGLPLGTPPAGMTPGAGFGGRFRR